MLSNPWVISYLVIAVIIAAVTIWILIRNPHPLLKTAGGFVTIIAMGLLWPLIIVVWIYQTVAGKEF